MIASGEGRPTAPQSRQNRHCNARVSGPLKFPEGGSAELSSPPTLKQVVAVVNVRRTSINIISLATLNNRSGANATGQRPSRSRNAEPVGNWWWVRWR